MYIPTGQSTDDRRRRNLWTTPLCIPRAPLAAVATAHTPKDGPRALAFVLQDAERPGPRVPRGRTSAAGREAPTGKLAEGVDGLAADDEILSPDDEISWLALQAGTKVLTSDGRFVGHVTHVLGDLEEDVFDGIGVRHGLLGQILLPRAAIARITRGAVYLAVSEQDLPRIEEIYQEEKIFKASEGKRKLRWRRVEDEERF